MLSAVEASQTADKEIFRYAQNDTEREVVILNGTQCSEVSHSANWEIFRFAKNDSADICRHCHSKSLFT